MLALGTATAGATQGLHHLHASASSVQSREGVGRGEAEGEEAGQASCKRAPAPTHHEKGSCSCSGGGRGSGVDRQRTLKVTIASRGLPPGNHGKTQRNCWSGDRREHDSQSHPSSPTPRARASQPHLFPCQGGVSREARPPGFKYPHIRVQRSYPPNKELENYGHLLFDF